jgi:hypothetical protein
MKITPDIFDKILKNQLKQNGYFDLKESKTPEDLLNKMELLNKGMKDSINWIKSHKIKNND